MAKARINGNIPAHRLLWIYGSEDKDILEVGLPKEAGSYVDFVTTAELEDGKVVPISITDKPVWTVEAGNPIAAGGNVAVDTDGRVGSYPSSEVRIGYALNAAEEGDLVDIVRNPKIITANISPAMAGVSSEQEQLEDKTVAELKEEAKELGIEGYSDLKKAELIEEIKKQK